jgi:hypothetical protein
MKPGANPIQAGTAVAIAQDTAALLGGRLVVEDVEGLISPRGCGGLGDWGIA